jgi:hypothetical protein
MGAVSSTQRLVTAGAPEVTAPTALPARSLLPYRAVPMPYTGTPASWARSRASRSSDQTGMADGPSRGMDARRRAGGGPIGGRTEPDADIVRPPSRVPGPPVELAGLPTAVAVAALAQCLTSRPPARPSCNSRASRQPACSRRALVVDLHVERRSNDSAALDTSGLRGPPPATEVRVSVSVGHQLQSGLRNGAVGPGHGVHCREAGGGEDLAEYVEYVGDRETRLNQHGHWGRHSGNRPALRGRHLRREGAAIASTEPTARAVSH